jgi:hypothetical protein
MCQDKKKDVPDSKGPYLLITITSIFKPHLFGRFYGKWNIGFAGGITFQSFIYTAHYYEILKPLVQIRSAWTMTCVINQIVPLGMIRA